MLAIIRGFKQEEVAGVADLIDAIIFSFSKELDLIERSVIIGTTLIDPDSKSLKAYEFHHFEFLGDHKYATYFGFTHNELHSLFEKHKLDEKRRNDVKEFYQGYEFAQKDLKIYNPLDISKYFLNNLTLDGYWIKNKELDGVFQMFKFDVFLQLFQDLLAGKKVKFNLITDTSAVNETLALINKIRNVKKSPLTSAEVDQYMTLLFRSGYFSYVRGETGFKLANKPIKEEFEIVYRHYLIFNSTYTTLAELG